MGTEENRKRIDARAFCPYDMKEEDKIETLHVYETKWQERKYPAKTKWKYKQQQQQQKQTSLQYKAKKETFLQYEMERREECLLTNTNKQTNTHQMEKYLSNTK